MGEKIQVGPAISNLLTKTWKNEEIINGKH